MNKTEYYDCFTASVVEKMYSDAVSYFDYTTPRYASKDSLKSKCRGHLEDARYMLCTGALSVDILVKRDGTFVLNRNGIHSTCDLSDVVFLYNVRLNANHLFDVARYDYRDEIVAQKEVKGDVKDEEYGVEYKGTTYVFGNAYERDLVESVSRLIRHRGDDVSGTEFGNMIKYVFRLLGVESDWTI